MEENTFFSKNSRNQCALDGKAFLNISYFG